MFFSKKYQEDFKKTQNDLERFTRTCFLFSAIISLLISGLIAAILIVNNKPVFYAVFVFFVFFVLSFNLIKLIPIFSLRSKKAMLESDLLYSARHLLLKIESGSSLINSIESVSNLRTKSSVYFKELMFDISLGMTVEDALKKSVEYSPSKAYSKILEEIRTSLKTGADLQKTLKSTIEDISRMHLIHIKEYGKKLNPMSMFYMILGAILPSIGTAILIVSSSLLPGVLVIDLRILLFITFLLLVVQVFFVLSFRSLKPGVME